MTEVWHRWFSWRAGRAAAWRGRSASGLGGRPAAAGAPPKRSVAVGYFAGGLLVAALAAQALPPIFLNSGVCDEHGAHIPSGYMYWRTGAFSGGINNPPLMQLLVAAPLALGHMDYTPFSDDGLWAARLPVLALSMALALAVFAWARSLYGRASAFAALFMFCFEPNVIAHSGLATLDMGVSVFLLLAFFTLWKAARGAGNLWWMLACLSMASALLTKFTAALVLPLFLALLIVARWRVAPPVAWEEGGPAGLTGTSPTGSEERQSPRRRDKRSGGTGSDTPARKLGRCAFAVAFMCIVMVAMSHALYHLPAGESGRAVAARGEVAGAPGDAGERGEPPAEWIGSGRPLERAAAYLLPDLYVQGSLGKLRHSSGGHFAYLAGRRSLDGWWYYFPVALALKTPVPFLAALLISLATGAGLKRRRVDAAFLILPPAFYVSAMAWTGVNIGVRHVLLFYPFAAVAASALLRSGLPRARSALAVLAAAAVWQAGGTLRIGPHYLAYFNEVAGGPRGGPRYLIDSNIDWGQDERLLTEFIAGRPDTVLVNPGPFSPSVGTIAVNVNSLKGIFRGDDTAYRWLTPFEPSRTLGYTWYIYELECDDYARAVEESPADPDRKVWLAAALRKSGRTDEALALTHEIAGEFPERSGNVLYSSGRWLLEDGRYREARAEFEAAARGGGGAGARDAAAAAAIEIKRRAGEAGADDFKELGEFYARGNNMASARDAIEEGMRLAPNDAGLRLTEALLAARDGDFDRASRGAAAALDMDPGLERARRLLSWARKMSGEDSAADRYEIEIERARHELRFERPASAARHFWAAFALNPSSQDALEAMGEIIVRAKLGVLELETPWGARWGLDEGSRARIELGPRPKGKL